MFRKLLAALLGKPKVYIKRGEDLYVATGPQEFVANVPGYGGYYLLGGDLIVKVTLLLGNSSVSPTVLNGYHISQMKKRPATKEEIAFIEKELNW